MALNDIKQIIIYKHKKFFNWVARSKWVLLNASLEEYINELKHNGISVDITDKIPKVNDAFYFDIPDADIKEFSNAKKLESPYFLLNDEDLNDYSKKIKSRVVFNAFYRHFRTKLDILMVKDKPLYNRWVYDEENRGVPSNKSSKTKIYKVSPNSTWDKWVKKSREPANAPYIVKDTECSIQYASNRPAALLALKNFITKRLDNFGNYQDFYDKDNWQVDHSVISMYLNIGLLTPKLVLNAVLKRIAKYSPAQLKSRMNSIEGFVRQLFWREYMYFIYYVEVIHGNQKTAHPNFFENRNKMTIHMWRGTTGIEPVDHAIKSTLSSGYLHHNGRLMILGSYFLLAQIHPNYVFEWFNALYVDAYDWVMWGNVYSMSQYAMKRYTARPYFSSSKYLKTMTNFEPGEWEEKWDDVFHKFLAAKKNKIKTLYLVSSWI